MTISLSVLSVSKVANMKKNMERRKHKRYKAQEGVYFILKDKYYIPGQIIDISKGGFAFLYITDGEKMNGRFNVDLFSYTDAFFLKNIPFKTISDFKQDNETPLNHGEIRRCGGQVDKLTQSQKIQFDYFIKSYITQIRS
jgi:hypothetical protein